jgi:hypothetical protein
MSGGFLSGASSRNYIPSVLDCFPDSTMRWPKFEKGTIVEAYAIPFDQKTSYLDASENEFSVIKATVAVMMPTTLDAELDHITYIYILKNHADAQPWTALEENIRRFQEVPDGWEPKESK